MSGLKKLYYNTAALLPMNFFRSGGPMQLLLPYHHVVSNQQLDHIHHLYEYKNEKEFTADLDFFLKNYKPVAVADVYNAIHNNTALPKGSFLFTFDDGFKEVHDIIAPILEQKGVPAIFFINPSFIDNKQLFYRCKISLLIGELKLNFNKFLPAYNTALKANHNSLNAVVENLKLLNQYDESILDSIAAAINFSFDDYRNEQQPFLTTAQVKSLHNRGFTIGAHSMDHPYYKLLDETQQVKQTIDSCNYVSSLTGDSICHFSFPHSDEPILQTTIAAIHEQQQGLLFGIQNQKNELHNKILHRFNAERPGMPIDKLVKGQLLLNSIQQVIGKNKVNRK